MRVFKEWRSRERLALAAFVCLLALAAGLRFYDLPGDSVWYDEAVASGNARGALAEVIPNTSFGNSSPILYPLALWAVQKVDVSAFSIRILPAIASVLTVAVMLFLLPRFGVSRWAAFLAALLATVSVAAIEHAQDAREYSIDALLAALLIAGLLWYLRDGRKGLLCVALFVAPLLQYGLVLFGIAVIGAALILPAPTLAGPESESDSYRSRIRKWFKQRSALVWPAACLLAGCAVSYAATLRHQWRGGGWDGWEYFYYQGGFDVADVLGFATARTWALLNYHLPPAVAVAAVAALAVMLAVSLRRRRFDAVAILALLAVGIAIIAALLTVYPLGDIRQNLYLGPVIFLAAGAALHWAAAGLAGLLRRAWAVPALGVVAAGGIALAGVSAMGQDNPYETSHDSKEVIAFLEEYAVAMDVVYVTIYAAPVFRFYQDEKPGNYHYGAAECWRTLEPCNHEMVQLIAARHDVPDRILMVDTRKPLWRAVSGETGVQAYGAARIVGEIITAYLVNDRLHRADDDPVKPWGWQRADIRTGAVDGVDGPDAVTGDAASWTDIAGVRSFNYAPTRADIGKFVRAGVSYEKNGTTYRVQTDAIGPIEGFGALGERVAVEQASAYRDFNIFVIAPAE